MPEVGVIALVSDAWDSPWQTRHQILSRLARYFHVVWVEPARDLTAIPHPRTGYTGYLKRALNWDLCLYLAHKHPEWPLVFEGSVAPKPADAPNHLGHKRPLNA